MECAPRSAVHKTVCHAGVPQLCKLAQKRNAGIDDSSRVAAREESTRFCYGWFVSSPFLDVRVVCFHILEPEFFCTYWWFSCVHSSCRAFGCLSFRSLMEDFQSSILWDVHLFSKRFFREPTATLTIFTLFICVSFFFFEFINWKGACISISIELFSTNPNS